MADLRRNLGLAEAVGLSLSVIAPTMAMAFNVTLAVQAAGRAAPLAFAVGTLVLAIVGLSFVAFSRRVPHAGSAYAYITHAFGPRAGFVAGWALLLTYLAYASGTAALVGSFTDAALKNYALHVPGLGIVLATLGGLLAIWFAYTDMKLAARLMLALEGLSVLAILVLGLLVIARRAAEGGLSAAPFIPAPDSGWSGVGYGLVYAVLSFAGFEAAATLGEETENPRRNIPVAILGTVLGAGAFYVLISYAQVIGYGLDQMQALGQADAPLDALATRYVSRDFAAAIDIAAAISAFSCVLGAISAAARMTFALGRAGLAPMLARVHETHRTPGRAVLLTGLVAVAALLIASPLAAPGDYYGDMGTIGTLALILVYMGVTVAEAIEAFTVRRLSWALAGTLGAVLLLWPLWNSLYPVPAWPGNLWPYVVLAWIGIGLMLLLARPAVAAKDPFGTLAKPGA